MMMSKSNWWEPTFTDVEVLSNEKACPSGRSRSIRVSAPEELRDSYRAPGQYIQVREFMEVTNNDDDDDDEEEEEENTNPNFCFLPLSSAPRKDYFEFLVKDREDRAWLMDCQPGTVLQLSGVLGKGFQPREIIDGERPNIFDAKTIIMAANGSGLASLKAAIESGRLTSGGTLYYGERTLEDLCYQDKYAEWEKDFGFRVVPCLSRQPKADKHVAVSTTYKQGYVQDALKSDGLDGQDPGACFALVCGIMAMMDSVTDYLKDEGVDANKIMLNLEA